MNAAPRIELTVTIDPASEPIAGAVGDGRGHSVEFSGWLGFAAALEELLSGARAAAPVLEAPVP